GSQKQKGRCPLWKGQTPQEPRRTGSPGPSWPANLIVPPNSRYCDAKSACAAEIADPKSLNDHRKADGGSVLIRLKNDGASSGFKINIPNRAADRLVSRYLRETKCPTIYG